MAHEDKLIEHLSKEIETHTKNMMTFRARINFAVFVGPFVLLSSLMIGAKGVPRGVTPDIRTIVSAILLLMSYILMASTCAAIERQMWTKCNAWTRIIARIIRNEPVEITGNDLVFKEEVRLGYALVYAAVIVAFACAAWIVSRVNVVG